MTAVMSRSEAVLPSGEGGARDASDAPAADLGPGRVRALVADNFGFVWRSLLRLGVRRADAEDALQQVFIVAARKVGSIEPGRDRAFLFGTALRIASRARRTQRRRREVLDAEPAERLDPGPSAEDLYERARARAELYAILDGMPLELRAVFVLFELEQATTADIAALLDLPRGTVASRLRRAREHFEAAARRLARKDGSP
jgi:RNA polymerase sigma-70 factor (ECF subfamily)